MMVNSLPDIVTFLTEIFFTEFIDFYSKSLFERRRRLSYCGVRAGICTRTPWNCDFASLLFMRSAVSLPGKVPFFRSNHYDLLMYRSSITIRIRYLKPGGCSEGFRIDRCFLTVPTDGDECGGQIGDLQGVDQREHDQADYDCQQDHSGDLEQRVIFHGCFPFVASRYANQWNEPGAYGPQ